MADTTPATNEAATAPSDDDVQLVEESTINFDGTEGGMRMIESTSLAELSEIPSNGFEMIDDENFGAGDPELDELEAEIARELEDM